MSFPRKRNPDHGGPAEPGYDPLPEVRALVTSRGAHAILDEVERGRECQAREPVQQAGRRVPADYRADPAAFGPLPLDRYVAWLRAYLAAGGQITDVVDYPYPRSRFLLATRDFTTGDECGADAREILVPPGIKHLGGSLGHCKLYFESDGSAGPRTEGQTPLIRVYSDPAFRDLPGYTQAVKRERKTRAEYEQEMRVRQDQQSIAARTSDLSAYTQSEHGRR